MHVVIPVILKFLDFIGFSKKWEENMVGNLILVNIIATRDFLINPLGLVSGSEANLFKYDVFRRSG